MIVAFILKAPIIVALKIPLMLGSSVLALGGISCLLALKKQRALGVFNSIFLMVYACLIVVILSMPSLSGIHSTTAFASILKPLLQRQDLVAIYASPDHFSDLPFHLKRRVIVVGSDRGTLYHESMEDNQKDASRHWFMSAESFSRLFNSGTQTIYCLLDKDKLQQLEQTGLRNYQIIKEDSGKILIVNTPFLQT